MLQVSEAISRGLPVAMSNFTKESFGNNIPGCVGSDARSFAKCIIDLHDDKSRWAELRNEGLDYIQRTHSRPQAMEQWARVINDNLERANAKNHITEQPVLATAACVDGEKMYLQTHRDVAAAVERGDIRNGFHHWISSGKQEGRAYICSNNPYLATQKCPRGEEVYLTTHPDVATAVEAGRYQSGFHHWIRHGNQEGRTYSCKPEQTC